MNDSTLIFGTRPVIEAIEAGRPIERIFIKKGLQGETFFELNQLIRRYNLPFQMVPVEKLNRLTRKNHQGIVAIVSPIIYQKTEMLLPGWYEQGLNPLVLILDRITDVRNMGAVARTAECTGVNAILFPSKGSARINADAVKTSAGALNRIAVEKSDSLTQSLKYLKNSGLQIVACTEKSTLNYLDVDYTKPTAIIMGSEEDGISGQLLKQADVSVSIPLKGEIGSLNVSVAAGVILYEAVRQRSNE
ncbi:MAG: 23S rRNA (guanosine(2251)-2'-O)-methyltransferase RlmB [Bacteroidales bacterium]|nr:23S rRNA (guanosine(2251)-2'-O)-methyltransferase RlmB [Bacteroidales bacterium]MDY0286685.1 23S rRNA (guanosine(2251)-2'-O)-methyltransferase RlmB [Bacteroidales bacterium]